MSDKATVTEPVTGHHMKLDLIRVEPRRVLMVVANPTRSSNNDWPVGFWASELTHPFYELTERGVEVTICSPAGGRVEFDNLSDPRDESQWSAEDLISMGFIHTPALMSLLENTPRLDDLDLLRYDALLVCGGQSPMFTFADDATLQGAVRTFYESERITAALCHGVSALVNVRLSSGEYLVEGKTLTGFANVEEEYGNAATGVEIMPWRVEDALRARGANYIRGGLFAPFVVRDGRLVTGQQQYSGRAVAQLLITMLGL